MKHLILIFKGFFMGMANIVPGVSGGTMALIVGIYEDFINAISHFFKNFKKNILFLVPVFVGMGLSILVLSKAIDYSYQKYPLVVTLFFMGLVIGGIPLIFNNIKKCSDKDKNINPFLTFFTFFFVLFFAMAPVLFNLDNNVDFSNLTINGYIILFFVGIIASATMVIPGISGSLVLMLLGYYYPVISTIKDITNFDNLGTNVAILGTLGLGIVVGIVLISKAIEYLFNHHQKSTYYAVLGFIVASVVAIPVSTIINVSNFNFNVLELIIGIIMLILGITISYYLGDKND